MWCCVYYEVYLGLSIKLTTFLFVFLSRVGPNAQSESGLMVACVNESAVNAVVTTFTLLSQHSPSTL